MIEVICEDGVFKAKGSFSLGIAGTFVNEDFDGEAIQFDEDLLDAILEDDELPFIESDKPDEIAEELAEYYNQKEREIAANAKQINDNILFYLFAEMERCEFPFWEIKETILPGYPEKYSANGDKNAAYRHEDICIDDLWDDFDEKPNNGTEEKPDVEALIRRLYPMFNLDGFIKSFKPEYLYLNGEYLSFQFSDGWGAQLACAVSGELDENFTFTDWHNH